MLNLKPIHLLGRASVAALLIASYLLATSGAGHAADPRGELLQKFQAAVKGKKVAWVPVWLGVLEFGMDPRYESPF